MTDKVYGLLHNKTHRTPVGQYIGRQGEIFYDPTVGDLRLSDGITPGGLSANGGNEPNIWVAQADSTYAYSNTQAVAYDTDGNTFALLYQGPRAETYNRSSVVKISPTGTILWTRDLADANSSVNPWSLAVDFQNNAYIITQHYNPTVQRWNNTVVKLSGEDGSIKWQHELQDSQSNNNMQVLAIDAEFQGIAVIGTSYNGNNKDFFFSMITKDGEPGVGVNLGDQWDQEAYGAAINGNYIVITGKTSTFGQTYMHAIKFDTRNGNIAWQNGYTVDDGFNLVGSDVVYDNNGSWVVLSTHSSNNAQGIITTRLNDNDGSVIWSREISNGCASVAASIAADSDGIIYISGTTYSGKQLSSGAPGMFRVIGAYNSNGEPLWQKYFRGDKNQWVVDNNWWNDQGSTGKTIAVNNQLMIICAMAGDTSTEFNTQVGLISQFPKLGLDQGIGSYELRQSFMIDKSVNLAYNNTEFSFGESGVSLMPSTSIVSIKSDLKYYVAHAGSAKNKLINGAKSVILGPDGQTEFPGDLVDPIGNVRAIPRKALLNESNHTLSSEDNGQFFYGQNSTIYVPKMGNTALPIGFTVTIITNEDGQLYVYTQDSNVTRLLVPGVNVGNGYVIPAKSMATLIKVDAETWYLSGYGVGQD